MGFKKNIVTLSLLSFLAFTQNANATKLPNDVWQYVQKQIPTVQQRFDSVLLLDNDIMYIPLSPPSATSVSELKIEYSYPENQALKDLPEVILLNNGYSFLKVFKDSAGNYTLTQKDDLPIKVRLGLMPQDMLTPIGLKMPESLKLTLGDLLIPSKDEGSLTLKESDKKEVKNPYSPAVKRNEFIPAVNFEGKKTFINPRSSKFLAVYDGQSQTPSYELKLSSMPLKIISSEVSNVALVLYWSGKNAEIIDLKNDRVITTLTLEGNASDVVLNKKDNLAYVASQNASTIYIVNLNSMQIDTAIKIDQKPARITYSEDDNLITFYDEYLAKIFNVEKVPDGYEVKPVGEVNNVTKLLADSTKIYAISRSSGELNVFEKSEEKPVLLNTVQLDKKPVDALIFENKIYILCAQEGYMDVYDIEEAKLISRQQLARDGFYSKMTLIPNENNIVITGVNSKAYLIYNLEKMKLTHTQDSYVDVSNIIILDKTQRL